MLASKHTSSTFWPGVPVPPNPGTLTLVTVGVLAVGLAWTIAGRSRGPHDLLTGTWVVPR